MITRLWHGWTHPEDADAYETLLCEQILPPIQRIDGCLGAYVLRRADGDEVQFVTLTLWRSLDAIRAFAGPECDNAVIPAPARRLLSRYDARALHYDTRLQP